MLVLGVGRATDLPPIKGRAIWKVGSEMIELQTPLLTDTECLALLEPLRKSSEADETDESEGVEAPNMDTQSIESSN